RANKPNVPHKPDRCSPLILILGIKVFVGGRLRGVGFATEKGALPQMKFGELVSGDFFRVLDVPLALERPFRPEEDRVPGRDVLVVLGYELWRAGFPAWRAARIEPSVASTSVLAKRFRLNSGSLARHLKESGTPLLVRSYLRCQRQRFSDLES